jgi:hypothetical protein
MSHRTALSALALVVVVWLCAMAFLMNVAGGKAGPGTPLLVLFPPGKPRLEVIHAISRSDGMILRDTALNSAWFVSSLAPGFQARLRAQGAIAVFADLPYFPVILGCVPHNVFARAERQLPPLP